MSACQKFRSSALGPLSRFPTSLPACTPSLQQTLQQEDERDSRRWLRVWTPSKQRNWKRDTFRSFMELTPSFTGHMLWVSVFPRPHSTLPYSCLCSHDKPILKMYFFIIHNRQPLSQPQRYSAAGPIYQEKASTCKSNTVLLPLPRPATKARTSSHISAGPHTITPTFL
jgi:hypothetical protein